MYVIIRIVKIVTKQSINHFFYSLYTVCHIQVDEHDTESDGISSDPISRQKPIEIRVVDLLTYL
jgi:hypothetical protein